MKQQSKYAFSICKLLSVSGMFAIASRCCYQKKTKYKYYEWPADQIWFHVISIDFRTCESSRVRVVQPFGALSMAFRFMSRSRNKRAESGTSFCVFSANSFSALSPCRQKGIKFRELWLFTDPKTTIYKGYAKSFRALTSLTSLVHRKMDRT